MRQNKHIKRAYKAAEQSIFRQQVGAVIVKHGRVVSTGFNKVGHKSHIREFPSIHAEESAILKLLNKHNGLNLLAGATIYVTRIMKDGTTGIAKPCKHCQDLINTVGIKKIVHT